MKRGIIRGNIRNNYPSKKRKKKNPSKRRIIGGKIQEFEEEKEIDYKKYSVDENEKEFEIVRLKAHLFKITGDKIIKFYKMTNITTDEGMMILMKIMKKMKMLKIIMKKKKKKKI